MVVSGDHDGSDGIILPDGYVLLEVDDRFCLLDPDGVHLLIKPNDPEERYRLEHFAWQHALDDVELQVRRDLRKFRAVTTPSFEKLRRLREYRSLLEPSRPAPPDRSLFVRRRREEGISAVAAMVLLIVALAAGHYMAPLPQAAETLTLSGVEEGIVADQLRESAEPRRRSAGVGAQRLPVTAVEPGSPERISSRSRSLPEAVSRRGPALQAATSIRAEPKAAPRRMRGRKASVPLRRAVRARRYTITVGVFTHPDAARARAQMVRRKGYVARVVSIGPRFRVEAGAYKNLAIAEQVAEAFRLFGLPAVLSAASPFVMDGSADRD